MDAKTTTFMVISKLWGFNVKVEEMMENVLGKVHGYGVFAAWYCLPL